jgi:hypothetical protein
MKGKFRCFHTRPLAYNQYKKILSQSFSVLDLPHPDQKGLTMRSIEALGENKKIITTEAGIAAYDFFNEQNIFVFSDNLVFLPKDFFKKSYVKVNENVRRRYTLDAWLSDIFLKVGA